MLSKTNKKPMGGGQTDGDAPSVDIRVTDLTVNFGQVRNALAGVNVEVDVPERPELAVGVQAELAPDQQVADAPLAAPVAGEADAHVAQGDDRFVRSHQISLSTGRSRRARSRF